MEIGSIKEVDFFSFLPKKVEEKWIWLTTYTCVYVYGLNSIVKVNSSHYYNDWSVKELKLKNKK